MTKYHRFGSPWPKVSWLVSIGLIFAFLLLFFDGCSRVDYVRKVSSVSLGEIPPSRMQKLSGGVLEPLILPTYAMDARWWVMHAKQMLREGSWRVRHTATDNAPEGREVHWSSLLVWLLCGVAGVISMVTGQPVDQCVAPAAMFGSFVLLAPVAVLLGLLARLAFGGFAALFFLTALATSYPFIRGFLVGDTDHHGLVAALIAASLLCLVGGLCPDTASGPGPKRRPRPWPVRPTFWPVASGIFGAAALWVSAATALPVLAAAMAGAVLSMVAAKIMPATTPLPRYWTDWGISGCLACFVFYLLEYFPGAMGWRLEVNHPLYGLSWLGASLWLAAIARFLADPEIKLCTARRTAVLCGAALLASIPLWMIWLGGSRFFLVSDPFLLALHEQHITEFRSLAEVIRATQGSWDWFRDYPWVLACAGAAVFMGVQGLLGPVGWARLALLLPPVLLMQGLAIWQVRWGSTAWALWALWSLVLVSELLRSKDKKAVLCLWLWVGFLWLSLYLSLFHWTLVRAYEEATCVDNPLKPGVAGAVIHRDLAFRLATSSPHQSPVVLAGPSASTELSFHGGLRTLGTLYWENTAGLKKAARIFAAGSAEEAQDLLTEACVTHLVLPVWSDFAADYAKLLAVSGVGDAAMPFFRDLLDGKQAPDWLRPLAYPIPSEAGLDATSVRIFAFLPQQSPAEAAYYRGVYHEESGAMDQALEAYRLATMLDPGNRPAAEAVARMGWPNKTKQETP
jgi:hypothetical protein